MISNRLPTNPKAGDTWSEVPIAWWRRGLIYVAESALRTAGENFRADSIQADRLRHQLVFTFDADHACWRAPLRGGWEYFTVDGQVSGWSSVWPRLFPSEFAPADVQPQTQTPRIPQEASRS